MLLVLLASCASDDAASRSDLAESLFGSEAEAERQAAEIGRQEVLQECMSRKGFELLEAAPQLSTGPATSFRVPVDPVQAARSGYGIAEQLELDLDELGGRTAPEIQSASFALSQAELDAYVRAIDGDGVEIGCREEAELLHPVFPIRTTFEERLIRDAADNVAHSEEYRTALQESEACMARLGQADEAGVSVVHGIHDWSDAVFERALSQLESSGQLDLSGFGTEIAQIRSAEIAHATASAECESAAIELYNSLFEEFVRGS